MRFQDLFESVPFKPGAAPSHVVDFRDPEKAAEAKARIGGKAREHVVLTKSGGAIVFYYGHLNSEDWATVLDKVGLEIDPIQGDAFAISALKSGYLIDRDRNPGRSWSGNRNRYSDDIKPIVQRLVDLGFAGPATPFWIGSWAREDGENIGTARSILERPDVPKTLTLYHGTSTSRLPEIMRDGLKALDVADRVWNKGSTEKSRPAHRAHSVYLTASRPQAEYYAKKAVDVDRKRRGPAAVTAAKRGIYAADQSIAVIDRRLKVALDHERPALEAQKAEWEAVKAKSRKIADIDATGKVEPVILKVTIRSKDLGKLWADDDHLAISPDTDPRDWQKSLSQFGQVAFADTIPPERLQIVAQGAAAGRLSS